jgi:hypothetical protein
MHHFENQFTEQAYGSYYGVPKVGKMGRLELGELFYDTRV